MGISCGAYHTGVLLANGSVKTFGDNYEGQLGNGTNTDSNIPVDVSGVNNAILISCGSYHTCIIINDGTVKTVGSNSSGQLGNGTNDTSSNIIVDVSGIENNVIDIIGSWSHTILLFNNGSVKTVGDNFYGQLGDGTNINKNIPVSVSNLGGSIITNINGSLAPISYKTLNNVNNLINMLIVNKKLLVSISSSIDNLNFTNTNPAYATGLLYNNVVCGFSINATNIKDNNNMTDFSDNNLKLSLTLPKADINNSLKIYKRVSNQNNLMNPQPTNYPINLIYNVFNDKWECFLPSLSEYFIIDENNNPSVPCFTDKTEILTPSGYINIRELNNNDIILTHDNRQVPIIKIYSFDVIANKQNNPYIIPKNSIDKNYPPQDIILSGKHLIRYKNGWIQPESGFNGLLFKQDDSNSIIKYYHIKLPNYLTDYIVINGGCIVESYGDNIPVAIRKKNGLYQIIVK
jgi:hypothetical protein